MGQQGSQIHRGNSSRAEAVETKGKEYIDYVLMVASILLLAFFYLELKSSNAKFKAIS